MKKLVVTIISISLFLGSIFSVSAQEEPTQPQQDSYVLFWPIVAGKTEDDKFYSLKIAKEKLLGFFIFDKTKKVDYEILKGTKRVLETEKLIKDGKINYAQKSLEKAQHAYSEAYNLAKAAKQEGNFDGKKVRRDRLINVRTLIDNLKSSSPAEIQQALEDAKNKTSTLLIEYLP